MAIRRETFLRDFNGCQDYTPLPVGFMNAKFEGSVPNPNLPGIKTVKYQRSAIRPVTADVMAVALAKYGQGDKFQNARAILDQFTREAKEFKPPKPNLRSAEQDFEDLWDILLKTSSDPISEYTDLHSRGIYGYDDFVNSMMGKLNQPNPKYIKPSRGEILLKSTVARQAHDSTPQSFYEAHYYRKTTNTARKEILDDLIDTLKLQGVDISTYSPARPERPTRQEMDVGVENLLRIVYARGVNADLNKIFRVGLAGVSNLAPATKPVESDTASMASSSVSAQTLQTPRQQGITQPATSATTQEVEKK